MRFCITASESQDRSKNESKDLCLEACVRRSLGGARRQPQIGISLSGCALRAFLRSIIAWTADGENTKPFRRASSVKSAGFTFSVSPFILFPVASAPWQTAQFSAYTLLPLPESCARTPAADMKTAIAASAIRPNLACPVSNRPPGPLDLTLSPWTMMRVARLYLLRSG